MTEKKEYIERGALRQRLAASPLLSQMQASCFLKEGVLDIIQKFPAADVVEVVHGVSIPSNVMFFRTDYYHAWAGAVDEFAIGNVYFSSSRWV